MGMCKPDDFYLIWEFLRFGLTEKTLLQEILGLTLVYADWEKGGVCLRVCMFNELLRCFSMCDQTTALIFRWEWIQYIVIVVTVNHFVTVTILYYSNLQVNYMVTVFIR